MRIVTLRHARHDWMTVRTDPSGTANHRMSSQQPMILNCPYRLRSATSSVITVALWTLTWDAWGYLVPASRETLGTHPVRDRPSRYHIPALRTGPHTCVCAYQLNVRADTLRSSGLRACACPEATELQIEIIHRLFQSLTIIFHPVRAHEMIFFGAARKVRRAHWLYVS